MTSRKTRSFRHDRHDGPARSEKSGPSERNAAEPTSFWRRLFGGKPVPKGKLTRPGPRGAGADETAPGSAGRASPRTAEKGDARKPSGPGSKPDARSAGRPNPHGTGAVLMSTMPLEARPRNPKSFLAKKFNSQVVKAALLDAIGEAMDRPPPGITPIESKFWMEGLAFKGILVEQLDCSTLKPEEHLRAIQWMARVERANPLKATYREDLFALRYQLAELHLQEMPDPPEAVGQGGVALRRLYQVVRTKLEGLGNLSGEASAMAQREIAAYERLMEAIERAPIARLEPREQMRLANVFRRVDPYKIELTTRHARFDQNVSALIAEMEEVYRLARRDDGPPDS